MIDVAMLDSQIGAAGERDHPLFRQRPVAEADRARAIPRSRRSSRIAPRTATSSSPAAMTSCSGAWRPPAAPGPGRPIRASRRTRARSDNVARAQGRRWKRSCWRTIVEHWLERAERRRHSLRADQRCRARLRRSAGGRPQHDRADRRRERCPGSRSPACRSRCRPIPIATGARRRRNWTPIAPASSRTFRTR